MERSITRRHLVESAAVAGAVAAVAPRIARADGENTDFDREVDLVVLGSGSGLFAAAWAQTHGLEVLVLDKGDHVGGAIPFSGGCMWLPNNRFSQARGDSYEKALTYLEHMGMNTGNDEIMHAFLDNCDQLIDDFNEMGIDIVEYVREGYSHFEYRPNWEGAQLEGGRTVYVPDDEGNFASALRDQLQGAFEAAGGEILLKTAGTRLITRRVASDDIPEVIGVVAVGADGVEFTVKARRGVILATGGFEWNEQLCRNYLHNNAGTYRMSFSTNTGDGLRMVQSVGAELSLMNWYHGTGYYEPDGDWSNEHGMPGPLFFNLFRQQPGGIVVDQKGQRFASEWADYDGFAHASGGYDAYAENPWLQAPVYHIYDNYCFETYHPGELGFAQDGVTLEDVVVQADTIAELAEKLGIDPDALVDTVETFNKHAEEGRDPAYQREQIIPIIGVVEMVTHELRPVAEPPFRALKAYPAILGTIGGPKLNADAQVMHAAGAPVGRLFACGNCAGVGGPGPNYGGAGGTIGPAVCVADIAAHAVCALEDWDPEAIPVIVPETRVVEVAGAADGEDEGEGADFDPMAWDAENAKASNNA